MSVVPEPVIALAYLLAALIVPYVPGYFKSLIIARMKLCMSFLIRNKSPVKFGNTVAIYPKQS